MTKATMAKTDPDGAAGRAYRFGTFLLRPARRELVADGVPVTLGSRAFDLLAALVEHAGQVVSRDALTAVAWPRMVVEDSSLRVQIAHLRRVLGPEGPGIVTVPGQGYRFDGMVQVVDEGAAPAAQVIPAARVLPRRLTAIIGRDTEVARVQAVVQPGRVVTLVGIGGIGKTTVALAATERLAGDYADGICFLDLGTLPDPAQGLAAAFGAARMDALGHAMAGHRLLVVLDGCDYAPEAVAALLAQLAQAPGVAVLATSRHPLGAAAEHRLRLPPLDLPPEGEIDAARALTFGAVQLFASRAQASGAGYTLTDRDAPVVAALCRRLDGLPLAIELAAGCVAAFGVLGLLEQADDRFNLLEARRRSPQERQRSLRASLDWTYVRLSAPEQTALQRLSVLDGTFTLASAEAAIGADGIDSAAAADVLEALVAQSLVSAAAGDTSEGGPRFRLSPMVRAYARERLQAITSPR
ncbi:putative HTH-type transcriptional regulator [compost metagenome]